MTALGRRTPADWRHVDRYPFATAPPAKPVPVTIGVNWYTAFDSPVLDAGRLWIGRGPLGSIRGGHCVCLQPDMLADLPSWRSFYDQGTEGACVGFGSSRMMTLLNRTRYNARWLWNQAKAIDEWSDTNPGDDNGTSVRAAMDVLRTTGHLKAGRTQPTVQAGIVANRWATSVDEVRAALQSPSNDRVGGVCVLNSWGLAYPRRVWLPYETLARLLDEDGEATVVTDR